MRVGDRVRITMLDSFRYGEEYEVLEVKGKAARLSNDSWYTLDRLEKVIESFAMTETDLDALEEITPRHDANKHTLIQEVRRSHAEAAELRKRIEAKDRAANSAESRYEQQQAKLENQNG